MRREVLRVYIDSVTTHLTICTKETAMDTQTQTQFTLPA